MPDGQSLRTSCKNLVEREDSNTADGFYILSTNGLYILEFWKPAPFPWEPITFSESWSLVCCFAKMNSGSNTFFTETATANRYQDVIQQFISLLDIDERDCWLKQNGVTAHTANNTTLVLHEFFDGRILSLGMWTPRSPGLSPLGFYLWVISKNICTRTTLQTYSMHIKDGSCLQHQHSNHPKGCNKHEETSWGLHNRKWRTFPAYVVR